MKRACVEWTVNGTIKGALVIDGEFERAMFD